MSAKRIKWRVGLALAATLLASAFASTLGIAAKPAGGGGAMPPGRIFFHWSSEISSQGTQDRGDWSMTADGKDKQLAFAPSGGSHLGYRLHQGHRWHLSVEASPNYPWAAALFAVRDDGDPDFDVLLLEIAELGLHNADAAYLRWGKDDGFVSFVNYPDDGAVTQIWAAGIAFDDLTGLPALTEAPLAIVEEPHVNGYVRQFDFSPLGDQVVYELQDAGAHSSLRVADLITGTTAALSDEGYDPAWSPDSKYLACTQDKRKKGAGGSNVYYADVMRVSLESGQVVNLISDVDRYARAAFWR
jgi:hypothetical protein